MMNIGTAKLDHMLSMGKSNHDHFGRGYSGEFQSSKSVFVKEKTQAETKIPHSKTIMLVTELNSDAEAWGEADRV